MLRPVVSLLVLAAGCWLPAPAQAADNDGTSKELSEKVVEFARKNLGKSVGNGECWTLAHEALKSAGAKDGVDFRNTNPYVWGVRIEKAKDLQPGDLLQFENAKLKVSPTIDGKKVSAIATIGKHTAILAEVLANGKIKVLEQNVQGNKNVIEDEMDLSSLSDGKIHFYRPVKK